MNAKASENWGSGDAYERYMGRWSRTPAKLFLEWLDVPGGGAWADVGCGTGAMAETILSHAFPARISGVDRSAAYVGHARERLADARVEFSEGDAQQLPWPDRTFDAAVSALVLNFVPSPARMVAEMKRITRPGGVVAAYVWDYAGGMQMTRLFWDAVVALNGDRSVDQGERFPICRTDALQALFRDAGLREVESTALEFTMRFHGFDDYWEPFLGKQGSAPTYLASLPAEEQLRLREALRARLQPDADADGVISLGARAWAVRGRA